ncbi:thiol reductant ABC exporter subunit CydD [Tengunoibacter tsumagoiensis]|nr:thiol reductant ABC exporter subunit CydD [Tengunoibacter tsumagoiensis]
MNINKRLLQYVRTMRPYMAIVIALSLVTGLCIVLQAHYIAQIINQTFLAQQTLPLLFTTLLLLLLIFLLRAGLIWFGEVVTNYASCLVKKDLRQRLFAHLLKLGPMYVKGERSGEIVNTATEGVEALDSYFALFFPQLCSTMIIPVMILIVVFATDLLSGIILLVTLPVLPFFMILIGKQANAMTEKRWHMLSQMSAHFLDVLQGLTTLKLFGRNKRQETTIRQISDRFGDTTLKVLSVAFLSSLVMEMGATISNALIAVEIGLRLLYGNIPFEQAFFVLLLTPEFYLPLRSLGTQFHASMNSSASAGRIFDILETPLSDQSSGREASQTPVLQDTLSFEGLHYSYPTTEDQKQEALKGISFQIQRGQTVAVVGPSGSGKSTLASLLLRFIEPDQGQICIDGNPIQQYSAQEWRKLVAWQPQRPYLFNASVAENIRLGRPTASMDEVIQAAKQAQIHTFIQSLSQGYNTVIGERGARLSGGQAQRLSLARAFLKDAPILLLDEATSTLDTESEAEVLQTLAQFSHNRCVLIIAHRLNTIRTADTILVLQAGKIVAQGSHEKLLETSETYQTMIHAYTDEEVVA